MPAPSSSSPPPSLPSSAPTVAPYGAWRSPITAQMIAAGGVRLGELAVGSDAVYWLESRPQEGGRSVVVRYDLAVQRSSDVTPAGYNVRDAVHEYGGGSYAVQTHVGDGGSVVYFTNWDDQRIYRQRLSDADAEEPTPLTDAPSMARGVRYADLSVTPDGGSVLCVRETHHADGTEATNEVVSVDTASGAVTVLATGNDFYAAPRAAAVHDGIAWLTWSHPDMPWDETRLMSGSLASSAGAAGGPAIATTAQIAGGGEVSIIQPRWSRDGILHYVSDASGWWNLRAWRDGAEVSVLSGEFDIGGPDWVFGFSAYDWLPDGRCVVARGGETSGQLIVLRPSGDADAGTDASSWEPTTLEVPYSEISYLRASCDSDVVYFVGASPTASGAVVRCDVGTGACEEVRSTMDGSIGSAHLSSPRHIVFPTTDDAFAHAYYYPPRNAGYAAPADTKPPLMVVCHGGPTGHSGTGFEAKLQYWTSRGFALVDVNYRGSSGYGRAYRDSLKTKWGVYDTDDCIAAARYLTDIGEADPERVVIRGGSAGGYTVINALTFHDTFAAGAEYYGIADLSVFINDTHKFEARYLDSLVGPYPASAQRYHDRSAIHFIDQLSTPMIILQGLEDEIVPPSQAEIMVEALREKGVPYAYIGFEGEQHGFRMAPNIVRAQEAELYFYGKVLGFEPADDIADDVVEVHNLPAS